MHATPFSTAQLHDARESLSLRPGVCANRLMRVVVLGGLLLLGMGCAAVTNPVANGVPVHMVPDELLAPTKEGLEAIDLTRLRQAPPVEYLLAPGDTLGIYVEGVIGNSETPPPVSVPDSPEVPPSIGYPFPIRAEGDISLPFVGLINVAGLSIEQAEQKVIEAYLKAEIVRPENYRIIVTLFRPRYERILVVREDAGESPVRVSSQTSLIGVGTQTTISGGRSAIGQVVELPAYQNDVLNALARTGGLPGPDAIQEVLIYRARRKADNSSDGPVFEELPDPNLLTAANQGEVIRIPLKIRPGNSLPFDPDSIILKTGDIIKIRSREPELYFTGGIIPAGEFQLPFDQDVTLIEALLRARAPVVSGGISTSNLSGATLNTGLGNPSPSLVSVIRKTANGSQIVIRCDINDALRDPRYNILVQSEDVLLLQENSDEAMTRYMTTIFRMDLFFRWLDRNDAVGTGNVIAP
jgi:protein involved in polysaccharide export with SLBB domain